MKSNKSGLSLMRLLASLIGRDSVKSDGPGLPPFVPSAEVYLRRGKFYLVSEDRTQAGFGYTGDTVLTLPENESDAELGKVLLQALAASKDGVQDIDWDEIEKRQEENPLLRAAGVKNWSTFHSNCKGCSVALDKGQLEFLPSRLRGSSAEGIGEKKFFIPADSSLEEIGRAVRRCLEHSH